MLLIIGTFRLPQETLARAKSIMERMVLASRAESGCVHYSYAEDVLEPGLIHVKEIWRDQASLNEHFASKHIETWRSAWPALGITDRNLLLYESGEPRST